MNASETLPRAIEPLTPHGVAAFAHAPLRRLLLAQFVVALIAAVVVVAFLRAGWFPVVGDSIRELPSQGQIRSGKLDWRGEPAMLLAENRLLAFAVDLDHGGDIRSPAHLQIEFGRDGLLANSLLGYAEWPYPDGWTMEFNRTELEPRWGAWRPAICFGAGIAVVVGLMLSWALLATVYCLPVWLIGFFANRNLPPAASWRLSGAALMPGAAMLTAAIFFYGVGLLGLVEFGAAFVMHFVIGWIYIFTSPLLAPRAVALAQRKNPFATR